MSFTVATAITRLTGSGVNAFPATFDAGKQLQRINEVLEMFYDQGTWRGLHDTISLTTTSGIITLSATYQRLDGLSIPAQGTIVPIRSMQWAFSPGGPGTQDWTLYSELVAIDLGDNGSSQRRYQVSGNTTATDALTFSGLARKRFTYITDTASVVSPDCYRGIKLGVEAMRWKDEGDDARYQSVFAEALQALNGNLQEFDPDFRQVIVQPSFGMGSMPLVH